MRKLILLSLAVGGSATAQLIGTTGSFAESSYCKKYTCDFQGKTPLGANFASYSYLVGKLPANYNPMQDYDPRTQVTVYRLNNKIISGTFGYGAQDSVFYPGANVGIYNDFVGVLTGVKPTVAQMSSIEEKRCGLIEKDGVAIVTPYAKGYAISCVNVSGQNARSLTYSIFKQ